MTISRKTLMRGACFAISAVLALFGGVLWNGLKAAEYYRRLENDAVCSIREAASGMNTLSVELKKSSYAGTPAQMAGLSARIWKESGAVKSALESLPAKEGSFGPTYRFLSQVGDYSMYLSGRAANGAAPSDEDRQNIESLMEYSAALTVSLRELEGLISSGELKAGALIGENGFALLGGGYSGSDTLKAMENGFEDYPVLIYDGPFSDGRTGRQPQLTKNMPRISREDARTAAAGFAGAEESTLLSGGDEISNMPSYTFYNDSVTVGVAMNGGAVTYLAASREIGEKILSIAEGRRLAREFLAKRGVDSMTETYYELSQGVLTVNFAYYQDDVTCYTDLIKVGVAMDNGETVFYEARDYISSHRERDFSRVPLPPEAAMGVVSTNLEPESCKLALIPTPGGGEVLTWEFLCKGREDEKVLVYVNADTGAEERILILIENENGTLTI